MGSLGSTSVSSRPDEFSGALGDRRSEESLQSLLDRLESGNVINPNYKASKNGTIKEDYTKNCALCATAVALQARGYDVEAMSRDVKWRGFDSVFDVNYANTDNYILPASKSTYNGMPHPSSRTGNITVPTANGGMVTVQNPPKMPRGASKSAEAIVNKVKGWGDGAVGQISVTWKGTNSSHAINIMNIKGRIVVYDAQSNSVIPSLETYLNRTTANNTALIRLDNAPVKKNIQNLDKMVKRRNKK